MDRFAELLADENNASIKVVRFSGYDKTKMLFRNEYVKDNFVQGRSFTNLTVLNEEAFRWCEAKNRQETRGKGWTVSAMRQEDRSTP